MQAKLSVILLVVALCAIYSSTSAEMEGQQGSLRRLEEVNVRDEYDASAQPEDETAPTHSETEEEAEQEVSICECMFLLASDSLPSKLLPFSSLIICVYVCVCIYIYGDLVSFIACMYIYMLYIYIYIYMILHLNYALMPFLYLCWSVGIWTIGH